MTCGVIHSQCRHPKLSPRLPQHHTTEVSSRSNQLLLVRPSELLAPGCCHAAVTSPLLCSYGYPVAQGKRFPEGQNFSRDSREEHKILDLSFRADSESTNNSEKLKCSCKVKQELQILKQLIDKSANSLFTLDLHAPVSQVCVRVCVRPTRTSRPVS